MKNSAYTREIDKLGRIVIPKSIRKNLGIEDYDALELISEGDKIIIKKHVDGCIFCGSSEGVVSFEEKWVCKPCIEKLVSTYLG